MKIQNGIGYKVGTAGHTALIDNTIKAINCCSLVEKMNDLQQGLRNKFIKSYEVDLEDTMFARWNGAPPPLFRKEGRVVRLT